MGRLVSLNKNSYSSAKIAVESGRLYGYEKIRELSELEFDEILRYLEEHGFRKSVDESFLRYDGFYLVERVLNEHLSDIYKKVFLGASKRNRELLDSYYLKYQIHNFMVILRCKVSQEEDYEVYLIGDSRRKMKYIKAWEMPNIEGALVYISKKLKFDENKVLKAYEKGLYELENYLYMQYYRRLNSKWFKFNSVDEGAFVKFIRNYIDLLNARTFVKLKVENSKELYFSELYIEGGKLSLGDFEVLSSKSIRETMDFFKEKFGDLQLDIEASLVESLDRGVSVHKKRSESLFRKAKFGSPFYALRFLFKLEREMGMLRILLKAKFLNLSKEEVLDLIS